VDRPILPSAWAHQYNSTVINGLIRGLLTQMDLLTQSAVTRLTDISFVTHKQTNSFVYFLPSTRPGVTSSGPDESAYTYPTLCIHARCFCRLPQHVYSRVCFVVITFSPRFSLNRYPLPLGGSCHRGKRFYWSTPLPWGRRQDICITKFCVTKCSTHIRAHCSIWEEQKYLC